MHRYLLGFSCSLATVLALSSALAEGKIDLTPEPLPAKASRSFHVHDGFYLRTNLGLGSLGIDFDDGGSQNIDLEGSGLAFGLDLLVGGSPARGVALGGAVLGTAAFSVGFSQGGTDVGDRNVGLGLVGVFIDGFPNAKQGWHLGGAVGFANVDIENDRAVNDLSSTRGLGGAAWGGYDWWVADEWSTGILFRLSGALTGQSEGDLDVSSQALSGMLMFTALYH